MNPLIAKFIACAICAGYGHDTGRSHISDDVIEDIRSLALQIGETEDGLTKLFDLLVHESAWVRFHASQTLIWLFPSLKQSEKMQAVQTLKDLLLVDGIVALSAQVAVGVYESKR